MSSVASNIAVRAGAAGVDDSLRNALVVEVEDLFAKDEILQQRGPARAALEAVLVVANRHAVVGRHHVGSATCYLVGFATFADACVTLAHPRSFNLSVHIGNTPRNDIDTQRYALSSAERAFRQVLVAAMTALS